jgi:ubiquinone/menaquinone biosynthesis C-methylase UbiE
MCWIKKFLLFEKHTCPWWLAYSWDHRLRRWVHDARVILKPYLSEGDRVADIGCGMGYFTIAMADYVGGTGKVFAVDLQQQMLDILNRRAQKHDAGQRIQTMLAGCEKKYIDVSLDFILTFWMLHEVEDKEVFLRNWYSNLKGDGNYLLVEPRIHTSRKLFDEEVKLCQQIGFEQIARPHVRISRAVLFKKPLTEIKG